MAFQLTLQAKKKAEEAGKQAGNKFEQAADASKNTLDDLTYVGKSLGRDLTKTAKEAAAKKGLVKGEAGSPPHSAVASGSPSGMVANTGKDFFSSISSDMNTIAHSTTSMFSGLFGDKNKPKSQQGSPQMQQQKPQQVFIVFIFR